MVCGILVLCLIATHTLAGVVIVALLFGFFSGVFIALPSVIVVGLTRDKSKIGTRIGMAFALVGAGVLAGGPGAGGILGTDSQNLHWHSTWIYGGVCFLASFVVFAILRVWIGGAKITTKV